MSHLLLPVAAPAEGAAVSRVGGRPVAPAGTAWPNCRSCKKPMLFLAQIRLADTGLAGLPDRLLLVFMCQNDPGMCEDWSADSGDNCALLVPPTGLTMPPPPAGVTLLKTVDGVRFQPFPAGQDYPVTLDSVARGLGQAGDKPFWIQADETPACACGARMRFVIQLEDNGGGGINFGDAGAGYAFVCGKCPDKAKFLWQCC
ncbi:MAG: DUF1963 domain-containing protein [Planctomycetes bacterium]|nr:DUF1963 domain-containing protein [Planctomycetota bacterium]